MVPSPMIRTAERLTGCWWLARRRGWFGCNRLVVMVETEIGWMQGDPPRPNTMGRLDWRKEQRRATQDEISLILSTGTPLVLKYQPPLAGAPEAPPPDVDHSRGGH